MPTSSTRTRNPLQSFQAWTAISSAALFAVTWKLWTPQTEFPQVPAFAFLRTAPAWLDWLGVSGVVASLIAMLSLGRHRWCRVALGALLISLLVLFSLDQHRFQPWAYELALFSVIWLTCRDVQRLKWMRWLLISIYAYSALGKFDFEFLHTVGQQMLNVVCGALGVDITQLPESARLAIVATFPLAELAVAIGLAIELKSQTRYPIAGWCAIALHLGLILILGPLGLNHRLGVLVWNAQVAIQVYWLFVAKQTLAPENESPAARANWSEWAGISTIMLAMAMPITERTGLWDHWPSWALYAPHSSRVKIEVATPAIERLPPSLQALMSDSTQDAAELVVWHEVPISAWSLTTLGTPIYPQARFQLGIASQITQAAESETLVRVIVLGASARFSGNRRSETLHSRQQIVTASKRYWLNSLPRSLGQNLNSR